MSSIDYITGTVHQTRELYVWLACNGRVAEADSVLLALDYKWTGIGKITIFNQAFDALLRVEYEGQWLLDRLDYMYAANNDPNWYKPFPDLVGAKVSDVRSVGDAFVLVVGEHTLTLLDYFVDGETVNLH